MAIPYSQQAVVIAGVAATYNIPITALLGIYGQETNFGQNIHTSTSGAVGPFQFEPATAAQYNYPLTNNPTLAQFEQQAKAWGAYLVANNPSRSATGWAPAMRGGYTEAQAEANLAHIPAALKSALLGVIGGSAINPSGPGVNIPGTTVTGNNPLSQIASSIGDVASAVGTVGSGIGSVASTVTSGSFWLRVLEVIGGVILVAMGLRSLTGGSITADAAAAAKVIR